MQTRPSDTNKGKRLAYIVFSGVLLIAGFILVRSSTSAQDHSLLQLSDLPKGFVAVDNRYVVGQDTNADYGHLLTPGNLHDFTQEDQQRLSAYTGWQSFGALSPDIGLAMNFVYDYADEAEASWAVDTLRAYFESQAAAPQDIVSHVLSPTSTLRGRGYLVSAEDGETCDWFIGYRGNTLILFWVHGYDASRVVETYQATLAELGDK